MSLISIQAHVNDPSQTAAATVNSCQQLPDYLLKFVKKFAAKMSIKNLSQFFNSSKKVFFALFRPNLTDFSDFFGILTPSPFIGPRKNIALE